MAHEAHTTCCHQSNLIYSTVTGVKDIVVVVLSQADGYNSHLAHDLRADLNRQAATLGLVSIAV